MKNLFKSLLLVFLINFTLSQVKYPYYCKDEDRDGMCTMEYLGVCGWFSKSVQCIKAPCGITSGTVCQACKNKNVEYVTYGECNSSTSLTPSPYNDTTLPFDTSSFITPYICRSEDRKKNCPPSTDAYICAVKSSCHGETCKFKSKPCEACLVPDVEILEQISFCKGTFVGFTLKSQILVSIFVFLLYLI